MPPGFIGLAVYLSFIPSAIVIALWIASRDARHTCAEARLPRFPQQSVVDRGTEDDLLISLMPAIEAFDDWLLAESEVRQTYEAWSANRTPYLWGRYLEALDDEAFAAHAYEMAA